VGHLRSLRPASTTAVVEPDGFDVVDVDEDQYAASGVFPVRPPVSTAPTSLAELFRSLPPPTLVVPVVELGGLPKPEGAAPARPLGTAMLAALAAVACCSVALYALLS